MGLKLPEKVGRITLDNEDMWLYLGYYTENERIALMVSTEDGEPYATLSTNIIEIDIEPDEFMFPWYNFTPDLIREISDSPYFEDTGKRIESVGHDLEIPVLRLRPLIGMIDFGSEE